MRSLLYRCYTEDHESQGVVTDTATATVCSNGAPLLGRDWMSHMKLNWNEIKLLRTTKSTETKTHKRLEQILNKFEAVFQDQMGK